MRDDPPVAGRAHRQLVTVNQKAMVVDLAVEDAREPAVGRDERLVSGRAEIEDGQAGVAEGDVAHSDLGCMIRAPVPLRVVENADPGRGTRRDGVDGPGYTAHLMPRPGITGAPRWGHHIRAAMASGSPA